MKDFAQFSISFECQTFEEFRNAWGLVHNSPSPVNVTIDPPVEVPKVETPNGETPEVAKPKGLEFFDPSTFDYSAPFASFEDAYLAAASAVGLKRFPYGSNPPPIGDKAAREKFAEGLCAKIGLNLSRLKIESESPESESPESESPEEKRHRLLGGDD